MPYIEGFVAPVSSDNRDSFVSHARLVAPVFREFGASRTVDAIGDDVPAGKVTDFARAVDAAGDELISFGFVEYPSRSTRDAANERLMNDQRMGELPDMPFDGRRMIYSGFEAVVDEGVGGSPGYLDGFVGAVPTANRDRFIAHAAEAAPLFLHEGALRVVECWGDDVAHGKLTDFWRAVKAEEGETVIFSWIEWPDKTTRDAGIQALEPKMASWTTDHPMPFDGKRMIFGGFQIVNDERS